MGLMPIFAPQMGMKTQTNELENPLFNLNFRLICSDNASCKANYL